MKPLSAYSLFIALMLLFTACGSSDNRKEKSKTGTADKEASNLQVPDFNADSAFAFIEKQVNFGPRVPNTQAHKQCAQWLERKLSSYCAKVEVQEFESQAYNGTMLNLRNIIGSINPEKSKRILLAAHWDSRPFADKDTANMETPIAGANDGGSGVGVLLELARSIQNADQKPKVGIDIILFDGEDYGKPENFKGQAEGAPEKSWWCLGSQHWSKNKHEDGYSAYYGILLDMVGAKNASFYREGLSRKAASSVVRKIWDRAHKLGHGKYFVYENSPEIMDDHVFVNYDADIPMVNIVDYDAGSSGFFPDYHHTHKDDMDIISKQTLQAVGETVLHVVYNE